MRPLVAQLRLELALTLRNGESLLLTMGIPVALLAFFASVDVLPIDGEPVDFLTPGALALAVVAVAFTNVAIATGFDRSYGVLKRLGVTPLGRPRWVMAKALAVLAVLGVQSTLLVAAGLALGWRPELGLEVGVAVVGVILAAVGFTGLGLALAGRLSALMTLALANALFVVLLLCSGVVFSVEELPGALRVVAEVLPSTALADVLRGALTEGVSTPSRVWPVLSVWAAVGVAAAVRGFRWEPDR